MILELITPALWRHPPRTVPANIHKELGLVAAETVGARSDVEAEEEREDHALKGEVADTDPKPYGQLPTGFVGWGYTLGDVLRLPLGWSPALLFVVVQYTAVLLTGDSFFGLVTGGVVESLRLETGTAVRWHMGAASMMWGLGAVQFLLKSFRRGPLAWIHRFSGRSFLLLWFFVAGPTAAYLSVYVGIGKSHAQVWMTIFSMVSLDTTVYAYYFFWRSLLVARRRASKDSLTLHGKAMSIGLLFTMTILFQRPCQFVFIAVRKALLFVAVEVSPSSWSWLRWSLEGIALNVFDHNVGLSFTTALFGIGMCFCLDGPRSAVFLHGLGLDESLAEELFGSRVPNTLEVIFWRIRIPVYLVLRGLVTEGWAVDPISAA